MHELIHEVLIEAVGQCRQVLVVCELGEGAHPPRVITRAQAPTEGKMLMIAWKRIKRHTSACMQQQQPSKHEAMTHSTDRSMIMAERYVRKRRMGSGNIKKQMKGEKEKKIAKRKNTLCFLPVFALSVNVTQLRASSLSLRVVNAEAQLTV